MRNEKKTANYKILKTPGGNKYQFFCDLSDALICTTPPIKGNTDEDELMCAWTNYGRGNFDKCHCCGRWVMSVMYNPDVLNCVKCTPIEDYPEFCPKCGAKTLDPSYYCHMCGYKLLYGGEDTNESKMAK